MVGGNVCFTFWIYTLLLIQIQCTLSLLLMGFLFSYWLSSTNLCCSGFGSKITAGTIDHAQIALASPSPVET